jgi:hypothetical protein
MMRIIEYACLNSKRFIDAVCHQYAELRTSHSMYQLSQQHAVQCIAVLQLSSWHCCVSGIRSCSPLAGLRWKCKDDDDDDDDDDDPTYYVARLGWYN